MAQMFSISHGRQSNTSIKYCSMVPSSLMLGSAIQSGLGDASGGGADWHIVFSAVETPSYGSTYPYNYNPQIAVSDYLYTHIYLTWIGEYNIGNGWNTVVNRAKYGGGPWSSTFNFYNSDVASPTCQFADGTSDYIIAWVNGGYSTSFYKSQHGIFDFETFGSSIQVINNRDLDVMSAMCFAPFSQPYYFEKTSNVTFKKTSFIELTSSGRRGIVSKDSAEYYFTVGDLRNGGSFVDFVPMNDYEVISSPEDVEHFLTSNPFTLTDTSSFQFGFGFGVKDSVLAKQVLGNNGKIIFKVSLIDANTGNEIGEYYRLMFDKNMILSPQFFTYNINTNGIGNREVKLTVRVSNNLNGKYSLARILAKNSILNKIAVKDPSDKGTEIVKDYSLDQNYPNPFNPSTIIKYQIPNSGLVTLKIYDILGNEVATLVNENKDQGFYSVTFNASKLASGVYIYQIRSNDFISSKRSLK